MSINLAPLSVDTPIVGKTGTATLYLSQWLQSVLDRLHVAAYQAVNRVSLLAQGASVGATTLVAVAGGRYRVSWLARATQAATTSSSLIVTVGHTKSTVNCTQDSDAMVTNATNRPKSGSFVVDCDAGSILSFLTTYVSVGGTPMLYDLDVLVEALP